MRLCVCGWMEGKAQNSQYFIDMIFLCIYSFWSVDSFDKHIVNTVCNSTLHIVCIWIWRWLARGLSIRKTNVKFEFKTKKNKWERKQWFTSSTCLFSGTQITRFLFKFINETFISLIYDQPNCFAQKLFEKTHPAFISIQLKGLISMLICRQQQL